MFLVCVWCGVCLVRAVVCASVCIRCVFVCVSCVSVFECVRVSGVVGVCGVRTCRVVCEFDMGSCVIVWGSARV